VVLEFLGGIGESAAAEILGCSVSAMKSQRWIAAVGVAAAVVFAGADRRVVAADPQRPSLGPIILRNCEIKAVKTARVATDRPGVISVVDPKEGDTVKEGVEIIRLMDEVPVANWEVAKLVADDQIEVLYATEAHRVDELEYKKSVAANVQAPRTISEIELERLNLNAVKSGLQIKKATHDIAVNVKKADQAKAELDTYHILAPFDGFVSKVLKYRGEAVKQGDPILEMVNTDMVHVEGMVTDRDIWRVKRGSPVTVQLDIKNVELEIEKQVFRGKIGFVDQVANMGDTRVWAEVPNPGNLLRPGFTAIMTILPEDGNAGAATNRPAQLDSKFAGRRDRQAP
jgi:membrane fusion protein, multidrug efflux system